MTTFIPPPSDPAKLTRRVLTRRAFRLKKGSPAARRKFRARCPWGWSTWSVDREHILDIYRQAAWRSWNEDKLYHVDHFYPLNGELVSGLHVPANLQIIEAQTNIDKGNTYSPE
jgi:hypothetical protein